MYRHLRLCGLTSFLFLLSTTIAQTHPPALVYKLHAQKEHYSAYRPSALLYLLSDQALLIGIPQQNDKWVLKKITGWDTGNPKEETLDFMSHPPEQADFWGENDLKVDTSGVYAAFRIKWFVRTAPRTPYADVLQVDLRDFKIVSQLQTSDPLLAASNWKFAKNGELIANAMISRVTDPTQLKHPWLWRTITDTYEASALSLESGWKSSMPCRYELVTQIQAPNHHSLTDVSNGCAALVALAGVPSIENLPDGPPKSIPYRNLAGPTCQFQAADPIQKLALYGCRTGHDYFDGEIATTTSRSLKILSTPDGRLALMVSLPHNMTPYPALLANANGHTWLLLLRDGVTLEIYRIPT